MPSSYSPLLGIELIANGEQSGNWGTTTNNNLGTLLEQAIAKLSNVTVSGTSYTLANSPDGTAYESRSMALNIQGTLSATCSVICPSVSKLYVVRNATTGGQSIVIKTSAGTGITIANGATAIVLCDGTNVIDPFSGKVSTTGATMTGQLTLPGGGSGSQAATVSQITAAQAGAVAKAGDTMTGSLRVTNATDGYTLFATTGADPFGVNYDRFQIAVDTAQQKTYVGNYNGGSGSARALEFVVGGVSRLRINTDGSFGFYNNSGTKTANLDASGNLVVLGNVTAYGTP